MLFADQYLATGGNLSYVTSQLYNSSDATTGFPFLFMSLTVTVIKADLDYVATNWDSAGCDLWEEVYGFHFFTRLVLCRDNLANPRYNIVHWSMAPLLHPI